MTECEWCGRDLQGAAFCWRPSCLPAEDHWAQPVQWAGLLLCGFTVLYFTAQLLRGVL